MKKVFILFILFCGKIAYLQNDGNLKKGNELYLKKKYKEAESEYKKSVEKSNKGDNLYNLGNSQYKQENFEEATKQYEES
ncbi:MAG: hypothetical protein RLZZ546_3376, partial [Bacteroidota bacterium]